MIPQIFVSSTVRDLQHVRDGLRDSIERDLGYKCVMSEYGEVGYINPETASQSCLRAVRQCHIVVTIIGSRYGSIDSNDGLSVTHKEIRTARQEKLPMISLVESRVLRYRDVYNADPKADLWATFSEMDEATRTFQLLHEVDASEEYNAIVPFETVADAQQALKLQIANYVGDRLSDHSSATDSRLGEVLAEVKTIRNAIEEREEGAENVAGRMRRFLAISRTLLLDSMSDYRQFLQRLCGDFDRAIETIDNCAGIQEVIDKAGWKVEIDPSMRIGLMHAEEASEEDPLDPAIYGAFHASLGGYQLYASRKIRITPGYFDRLDEAQKTVVAPIASI